MEEFERARSEGIIMGKLGLHNRFEVVDVVGDVVEIEKSDIVMEEESSVETEKESVYVRDGVEIIVT